MVFFTTPILINSSIYSESFGIRSSIVFYISTKVWLFEKKKLPFFHNFLSHPFLAHRSIIDVGEKPVVKCLVPAEPNLDPFSPKQKVNRSPSYMYPHCFT